MATSGLFPAVDVDHDYLKEETRRAFTKRVAVIGRFDRSEDDDDLIEALEHYPEIGVVAYADYDHKNLARNQGRFGAENAYTDYREMLTVEQPELVAIGSGFGAERHHMVMASLRAGAHVLYKGPVAPSLAQADEIGSFAERKGLTVSVVNPLRFDSTIREFRKSGPELIGDLLEMRIYGAMGEMAGGRDLAVNGWPLFDLVRWLAGDAESCFARVLEHGDPITLANAKPCSESEVGPVAGTDISAVFHLGNDIIATFNSRELMTGVAGGLGIEFVGTQCTAQLFVSNPPAFLFNQRARLGGPPVTRHLPFRCPPPGAHGEYGERNAFEDWLTAIVEKRSPLCSVEASTKALEMGHAIFQSGLAKEQIALPLTDRTHPLVPRFAGPL